MQVALIALFSAAFGALVGGVFQIEASRRGLLRDRQLEAASQLNAAGIGTSLGNAMRSHPPTRATECELGALRSS